jgi:hypothetical protein
VKRRRIIDEDEEETAENGSEAEEVNEVEEEPEPSEDEGEDLLENMEAYVFLMSPVNRARLDCSGWALGC